MCVTDILNDPVLFCHMNFIDFTTVDFTLTSLYKPASTTIIKNILVLKYCLPLWLCGENGNIDVKLLEQKVQTLTKIFFFEYS